MLYTDLRRYITGHDLKEGSQGWYLKQFCEYSLNPDLSEGIMDGISDAIAGDYWEYGTDLFGLFLAENLHLIDVFGIEGHGAIIHLILSCFFKDLSMEINNCDIFDQFLTYSKNGMISRGEKPDELAEFLEIEFPDFVNFFYETPESLRNLSKHEINKMYEDNSDVCMESIILRFEEVGNNGWDYVLYIMGFSKVCQFIRLFAP